eukprot:Skav219047  [mRNA]  locus=scaffold2272:118894:128204:+ [translate_table: standard]
MKSPVGRSWALALTIEIMAPDLRLGNVLGKRQILHRNLLLASGRALRRLLRGEFHSRHQRFSIAALRGQCRSRGVFYKSMPIGRESAYGTLAHMRSDEGQHTLVELAWQAKRRPWQPADNRQVVAEELVKGGHEVQHVRSDGSTEKHLPGSAAQRGRVMRSFTGEARIQYPDWLLREEDPACAVASRLARPTEELARDLAMGDVMAELRLAANQRESSRGDLSWGLALPRLVVAQRKLARYQRQADEKGLLANKAGSPVRSGIKEDREEQETLCVTALDMPKE